jgi:hypothetical protein
MFEVIENHGIRREVVATADTFAAAKEKVNAMGVEFMEDDADHADCADAYTKSGRILAIQPKGFKL